MAVEEGCIPYLGSGAGGSRWEDSPRASILSANLMAALSDGHPYKVLIRSIASLSSGSKRTVVGFILCLSIDTG
jgi:hypothetical protein